MTAKYALKGINSDTTVCAACGKSNLKRVVWLAPLDVDGGEIADPSAYGTDCAARMMGWKFGGSVSTQTKRATEKFDAMLLATIDAAAKAQYDELVASGKLVQYMNRIIPGRYVYAAARTFNETGDERVQNAIIRMGQEYRNGMYPLIGYMFEGSITVAEAARLIN